jgi:hypothetical protein
MDVSHSKHGDTSKRYKIPVGTPEQERLFQWLCSEVFKNSEYCFEQRPKSLNEQGSHSSN